MICCNVCVFAMLQASKQLHRYMYTLVGIASSTCGRDQAPGGIPYWSPRQCMVPRARADARRGAVRGSGGPRARGRRAARRDDAALRAVPMMVARRSRLVLLQLGLLAAAVSGGSGGGSDCAASDAKLEKSREMLCSSLTQANTSWCGDFQRNGAATDWPSQAVYMVQILVALKSPDACLNTTYARDTVGWLNTMQTAAVSTTGNFFWTWLVFQVQYYDMPRQPGVRIEAPDTLGRKCWAFAFLNAQFGEQALVDALRQHALQMPSFIANYTAAIPLTMNLCDRVRANCFLNSSYDPRHNGTCPGKLAEFALGFERENFKPQQGRSSIADPWKGNAATVPPAEEASLLPSTCSVVPSPRGVTEEVDANATCEVLLAGASARLQLDRLPPSQTASNSLSSDAPNYLDAQLFAHTTPPSSAAPPRKAVIANIISGAANRYSMTDETAVSLALAARQASSVPLDAILFPECFLYNGSNAEVCDGTDGDDGNSCRGPHATACARAARMTNAYVVCPFYELVSAEASQDAGPMYNTAILLDRAGRQVGKYRKTFPTAEIFPPSTGEVNEGVLPGNLGVPVFDVRGAICHQ
eukprot:COSAG02_NODE_157_length_32999_cov_31.863647_7_plen_585_part_00